MQPLVGPAYVQYQQPPLQLEAEALGLGPIEPWQVRFKAFDYGVVSLSLTQPFSGDWAALISSSCRLTSASNGLRRNMDVER